MSQARIPTVEDVGGLPNFDPRERRIGSYSLDPLSRGAQALTRAGQQAGEAIEQAGQAVDQVAVSRDRNDYATAHADFLANKINFESSLAKDQDYTTLEKRYTDGVNGLADRSAQRISNPRLRDHFMSQVQPDIARGIATFKSHADGLEGNADVAYTRSLGDTFMKQAADSPSSESRRQIIDTYKGKIDALAARGRISSTDAEAWKRGWVGQFALADGEGRIDRGDAQGVVNELRAPPVTEDQVTDRILHVEGVSKNPNSSAVGFGQWTKGSWLEKIRQYRPDLAAGKSDDEILALRSDRNLGREMTAAYARENTGILKNNGIEATPGNVYLSHFLGPAGAVAVAKADPQRPVIDVLTDALGEKKAKEIVEANRSVLQGKLAGSVTQWSNGLMGGSKGFSFLDVLPLDKREALRQRAETKLLSTANEDAAAAKLDQYNVKASIKDDLESMTNTGKGLDSVPGDRVGVVLGSAAYQKWQDDRNDAHQIWSATHDLPTLPEPEIQSRLDAITPAAGEEGYARKQAVYEAAREKADAVRKARRDDPAGSMADDPAVKAALSAYDKNNPETFKAVVAARMAAQDRAGLEEEYRSPITKQEALQLTAPLRTMLPGQERQVLTDLGQKFEKMFGPDADTAFAYAMRAHKVDAETAQIAARVMRKLGLGQAPTEGEARQVDQANEIDAADRAIGRSWLTGGEAAETFGGSVSSGMLSSAAPSVASGPSGSAAETYAGTMAPAMLSNSRPEPFGPNLPDVKPRAIDFLLKHPRRRLVNNGGPKQMTRRADPYEMRARALAVEAGLDADAKIDRPGQRPMPTWCTFRDAARKEQVATETAAVAASLPPQTPEFQNAPLKVFGDHDEGTLAQMRNCMGVGNVVAGVICADGHLGYAQPVGGVIAYEKQISISGVGFDIGCGNMAVRLDTPYTAIEDRVGAIIKDVSKIISFGVGRTNDERVEHELFDDAEAWKQSDMGEYRQKAVTQLGTVGSGNHYVDLMRDGEGLVWIGVHFGSRGLGHTSATRYLKAAGGKDGMNVPPAVLDEDSELGRRYIAAMELAGRYSYAGREWVIERVRKIIGGTVTDMVHNHHNYAWRERHDGRDLWVVRKGATPAFPGQRGFVGGSMGDDAVIIEGVDGPEAKASLYSTIHGAGRLFGRKEAKRRFTKIEMDAWLQSSGVTLMGADLDESPMAYRRLPEVLAHHARSIKVLHTLRPFAVAMAGEGEFDPFKD